MPRDIAFYVGPVVAGLAFFLSGSRRALLSIRNTGSASFTPREPNYLEVQDGLRIIGPHRIVGGVIRKEGQRMNAFVSGGFEKGWKDGSAPPYNFRQLLLLPYYLNGQPVVPTGGASPYTLGG
jgi:hypothetical protein